MPRKIKHPTSRNPVVIAVSRDIARKVFAALKTDAGLHAYLGNNSIETIATAGKWMWIVSEAALAKGMQISTCPDLSIVAGANSAVGDMFLNNDPLDKHRQAIISGLAAAQRIEGKLTTKELMEAALELEKQLYGKAA